MISSNKLSLWPIFRRASYKLFPSLIPKRFLSLNRPKKIQKRRVRLLGLLYALFYLPRLYTCKNQSTRKKKKHGQSCC